MVRTKRTPATIPAPIAEAFDKPPLRGHRMAFEEIPVANGTKIRITHFGYNPKTVGLMVSHVCAGKPTAIDYSHLAVMFVDEANRINEFDDFPGERAR